MRSLLRALLGCRWTLCGMEPDAAIAIAISTAMTTARRIPLDPVCGMEPDDAVAVPSTSELSTVNTARKMLLAHVITAPMKPEHTQMRKHEVLLQAADSTNATNACSREWETEDAADMKSSMMKNEELKTRVTTAAVMKKKPQKRTFAKIADAHCKRRCKTICRGGIPGSDA